MTELPSLAAPAAAISQDERIGALRELILRMGDDVDEAMARASHGLVQRDVDLCNRVIQEDAHVNAALLEVRAVSFAALADRPDPGELRAILGLLHMASELERMADHCANIAGIGRDLADLPPLAAGVDLTRLAATCGDQLRQMLAALIAGDVERAREVAARDDLVNRMYHRIVDDIVLLMTEDGGTVFRGTRLVIAAQNFERIGDRVTNLAEDLIFLETGRIEELG